MNIFVVEDEAPARRRLIQLVEQSQLGTVIGQAASYATALEALAHTKPDVLLLDVELGDSTGFDLLQNLPNEPDFAIIFCTAYGQYAVEAFEVAALDYLLKPVTLERLTAALSRVQPTTTRYLRRIIVESRRELLLVPVEQVDWFEADRNYIAVHTAQREHLIRSTMDALEKRLNPEDFIRISRGAIVRISAITQLTRGTTGEWLVHLPNGKLVPCTRKSSLDRLL